MSVRERPGVDVWASSSAWYLQGTDEVVLSMVCFTYEEPPDDDWLSIAETIEFLPAEE
jgi:hypothetical protein